MQSLTIFMQLWTIYLYLDNILVLFVFRKLGWHPMLMWHYLIYPVINWYTKVQGVPDMGVWLYIYMKNIVMKSEICIAALTYGRICLLMSPDIICVTIGNIYRSPHDNNNNKNIETFINEMSPIIDRKIVMPRYRAISISTFYKLMNEKNMMIFFIWCARIIFTPKLCSPLVLPNDLIAFWPEYFAKSLARNKLIYLLLYF